MAENNKDTEKKENDWSNFISEVIQYIILIIIIALIGTNIITLSKMNMRELNRAFPTDITKPPYCGPWDKEDKQDDDLSVEDISEMLWPMNGVSFPYTYNAIPNELLTSGKLGWDYYRLWPLKWISSSTAWSWATFRSILKYFIISIKGLREFDTDINTKKPKDNGYAEMFIFLIIPFIILLLCRHQIPIPLGIALMFVGSFSAPVPGATTLAFFALAAIAYLIIGAIQGTMGLAKAHTEAWIFAIENSNPVTALIGGMARLPGMIIEHTFAAFRDAIYGPPESVSMMGIGGPLAFGAAGLFSFLFNIVWTLGNAVSMMVVMLAIFLLKTIFTENGRKEFINCIEKYWKYLFAILGLLIVLAAREFLANDKSNGITIGYVIILIMLYFIGGKNKGGNIPSNIKTTTTNMPPKQTIPIPA